MNRAVRHALSAVRLRLSAPNLCKRACEIGTKVCFDIRFRPAACQQRLGDIGQLAMVIGAHRIAGGDVVAKAIAVVRDTGPQTPVDIDLGRTAEIVGDGQIRAETDMILARQFGDVFQVANEIVDAGAAVAVTIS